MVSLLFIYLSFHYKLYFVLPANEGTLINSVTQSLGSLAIREQNDQHLAEYIHTTMNGSVVQKVSYVCNKFEILLTFFRMYPM
jgi:predicted secreted protein